MIKSSESLEKGSSYKILGWCEAVSLGQEVKHAEIYAKFRRVDGFGIYWVLAGSVDQEVQEWEKSHWSKFNQNNLEAKS